VTTLPDAPVRDAAGEVHTDVLVIGAGVAGLYAADRLPDHLEIVVADKGVPGGDSGSSPWAQGGLAAPLGPDDDPALHAADTLRTSDGLCDPAAVHALTHDIGGHVTRLLELGASLDRRPGVHDPGDPGTLALATEGGQRVARSVKRADATGAELVRVLRAAVGHRVTRLAGTVSALARAPDGRVTGAWVLVDGSLVPVRARAVLLATGGCGGLYAATTNPEGATGDGLALAVRAGAAVRDLEFVQFHPTGLAVAGSWRFLLTEALRGAGATLHDASGDRFLIAHHPDAELAPRHVVAGAILELPDGTAYLDATHLPEERLHSEFPTVLAGARRHGFDLASERVPVTPAAHYQVGGVRTDLFARTSVPGLFAAGEVACTGVHGANRMAGNSLAEALVFGARAATTIAAEVPPRPGPLGEPPVLAEAPFPGRERRRHEVRDAMLRDVGPLRDAAGLTAMHARLSGWRRELGDPAADAGDLELHHALLAADLVTRAALLRTESRGGHRRADHSDHEAAWAHAHVELLADEPAGT
jgi:L-aspartate oxidase